MRQGLVPALESSHRLAADLVRQPNDPLGHIVRRDPRTPTDRRPGPLYVLEQLVCLPVCTSVAVW